MFLILLIEGKIKAKKEALFEVKLRSVIRLYIIGHTVSDCSVVYIDTTYSRDMSGYHVLQIVLVLGHRVSLSFVTSFYWTLDSKLWFIQHFDVVVAWVWWVCSIWNGTSMATDVIAAVILCNVCCLYESRWFFIPEPLSRSYSLPGLPVMPFICCLLCRTNCHFKMSFLLWNNVVCTITIILFIIAVIDLLLSIDSCSLPSKVLIGSNGEGFSKAVWEEGHENSDAGTWCSWQD